MHEIRMKAPAKINLGLDVISKRADGYHDLKMIMQSIRLHDQIYIKHTITPGIKMKTNVGFLPENENNLCWKAAKLLLDEFNPDGGIFIDLVKHIPVAAGLAGGSSDAAAVLLGMNRLLGLGLSTEELMERGVKIGADVPFCILKGTALAEGIGEKLTRLAPLPPCKILLAKPQVHVSTKHVYGKLKADEIESHPDIDAQIRALENGDLSGVAACMGNVLESVTVPEFPVIDDIKKMMLEGGAEGAMMSGSGPTVFGLFREEADARKVYGRILDASLTSQVYVTEAIF